MALPIHVGRKRDLESRGGKETSGILKGNLYPVSSNFVPPAVANEWGRGSKPQQLTNVIESGKLRYNKFLVNYKYMIPKNTICLWFDKEALEAAKFYAETFPDSRVGNVFYAPSGFPGGKEGDVLTVEFTVCGIPCMGLNGGPTFKQSEAFSFQIATDDQEETDRYWNAIVGNGGKESDCGWCKDKWGVSWQITPRTLTEALVAGGDEGKRAFDAMMTMQKIDVAKIEAARKGN